MPEPDGRRAAGVGGERLDRDRPGAGLGQPLGEHLVVVGQPRLGVAQQVRVRRVGVAGLDRDLVQVQNPLERRLVLPADAGGRQPAEVHGDRRVGRVVAGDRQRGRLDAGAGRARRPERDPDLHRLARGDGGRQGRLTGDHPVGRVAQRQPGRRDRQRGGPGVRDPHGAGRARGRVRAGVVVAEPERGRVDRDLRARRDRPGQVDLLRPVVDDVQVPVVRVLRQVERVDEPAQPGDPGLGLGHVPLGVDRQRDHVGPAAVAGHEQLAVQPAVERVALVLDHAVRRVVLAERVGGPAVVAVRQGADRVLAELLVVDAARRVAAVQHVLAAGDVRVAVVAALVDAVQEVRLRDGDVGDAGDGRRGERALGGGVDPGAVVRAGRGRRRRAAGGRAVRRGEQVPAAGPDQVVRVADAGRVDPDRGVNRPRVVVAGRVVLGPGVERALPAGDPPGEGGRVDLQDGGRQQPVRPQAPRPVRRAHRAVRAHREVQLAVGAERDLVVQVVADGPRQPGHVVLVGLQVRAAQPGQLAGPVAGALERVLGVVHPQDRVRRGAGRVERDAGDEPVAAVGRLHGRDVLGGRQGAVRQDGEPLDQPGQARRVQLAVRPDRDGRVLLAGGGRQLDLLERQVRVGRGDPGAGRERHAERGERGPAGVLHPAGHLERVPGVRVERAERLERDRVAGPARAHVARDGHPVARAVQLDRARVQRGRVDALADVRQVQGGRHEAVPLHVRLAGRRGDLVGPDARPGDLRRARRD
ncbi:MAG: hypothetical protein AVDCRST_MAG64-849 [uncultured Phycisphaerae bacterium]|uniref:Uncharacterized protein n=1 Tax=uncultured Phycisphaerae bacterium TaxID=904963 RepID=A0A6J4NGI9_9BACT|nr:MAG: hypothetical protein AVDCRST_MAG64-849 [uncultured Phycisphaerae bacterium]